ncbi:MAG: hypothetical protein ABI459_02800 [Deltaproteobacteria bacterium]
MSYDFELYTSRAIPAKVDQVLTETLTSEVAFEQEREAAISRQLSQHFPKKAPSDLAAPSDKQPTPPTWPYAPVFPFDYRYDPDVYIW